MHLVWEIFRDKKGYFFVSVNLSCVPERNWNAALHCTWCSGEPWSEGSWCCSFFFFNRAFLESFHFPSPSTWVLDDGTDCHAAGVNSLASGVSQISHDNDYIHRPPNHVTTISNVLLRLPRFRNYLQEPLLCPFKSGHRGKTALMSISNLLQPVTLHFIFSDWFPNALKKQEYQWFLSI